MNRLYHRIAKIISILFHPIVMPSIGIILVLNSGTHFSLMPVEIKRIVIYAVVLVTLILPLLFLPILKLQGYIKDYKISEKKDRLIHLAVVTIIYFIGFYFFSRITFIPRFLMLYSFASSLIVLIAFFITLKTKISIHMMGIGGITGLLFVLMRFNALHLDFLFIGVFILTGLIAFARLCLNEHNPLQVYSGFLAGAVIVFSVFLF